MTADNKVAPSVLAHMQCPPGQGRKEVYHHPCVEPRCRGCVPRTKICSVLQAVLIETAPLILFLWSSETSSCSVLSTLDPSVGPGCGLLHSAVCVPGARLSQMEALDRAGVSETIAAHFPN